jgi:D-glycero-D-manno-heptose 1,7-bisphosphate phosphatase
MGRPAVFLDRDGTINVDKGYQGTPEIMELLPGAAGAVRRLNEAGLFTVVVTNQSIVARGLVTEGLVRSLNDRVVELVAEGGGRIDSVYYCPHHPDFTGPCECRKPAPGMLLQAAREHDLDLSRSYLVGDWWSDIGAGRAAGVRTVLLTESGEDTTRSEAQLLERGWEPDARVPTVVEAVDWILRDIR